MLSKSEHRRVLYGEQALMRHSTCSDGGVQGVMTWQRLVLTNSHEGEGRSKDIDKAVQRIKSVQTITKEATSCGPYLHQSL
jgi:hypothetical protein